MSLFTLLAVTFHQPHFESNLMPMQLHDAVHLALVLLYFAGVTVVSFIFPPEIS